MAKIIRLLQSLTFSAAGQSAGDNAWMLTSAALVPMMTASRQFAAFSDNRKFTELLLHLPIPDEDRAFEEGLSARI